MLLAVRVCDRGSIPVVPPAVRVSVMQRSLRVLLNLITASDTSCLSSSTHMDFIKLPLLLPFLA